MKTGKLIVPAAAAAGLYFYMMKPGSRKHPDTGEMKKYLYAHRGLHDNASDAPENSLAAFKKAVEHGYGMELDVQLSKDGVPVIMHDFTAGRMLRDENGESVPGKIRDYTFEELRKFHLLDTDERIPSFQEVLDLVDGRTPLIVEYKSEDDAAVCEAGDALLRDYKGLCCVESFNPVCVYWYRKNRPEVMRGQLSEQFLKTQKDNQARNFLLENLLFNWATKPDFIAYNRKHESAFARRICRNIFRNTAVGWTIKNESQFEKAKQDYDMIIFDSFIPEEM